MQRRRFIAAAGGVALSPHAIARAQTPAGVKRLAAMFSQNPSDPEGQARVEALNAGLEELGWQHGRNLRLDISWAGASLARMREMAPQIVASRPDAILASASTALVALKQATATLPIVFVQVTDPVGAGFVESLARPGGNITGLTQHEFSIGEKWVELLRQAAPNVRRIGVLFDPDNPTTAGYLRVIANVAEGFGLATVPLPIRSRIELEQAIDGFGRERGGGIILLPGPVGTNNREVIVAMALEHKLPTMFAFRYHVASGGLISYGVDNIDLHRRAAWYIDRILKGARPGDLPVQHATKFHMAVNLKTARALGLSLSETLVGGAEEVIE